MSTEKQKFELYKKLEALGFTYEEAKALRRIEMTLHRWAEAECNGDIQRDDHDGMAYRYFPPGAMEDRRYPIADREAGALKRLKAIVDARNARFHREATANRLQDYRPGGEKESDPIIPYHQGDPWGCALYLLKANDIPSGANLESCYTRGLAVCC